MAATPDEMFERVLSYCGFTAVLGPGILQRALGDDGAARETATAADYRRALPRLEARMKAYMPAEDVSKRIRRIVGYLAFVDGDLDLDDEFAFSRVGHNYQQLKERAEAAAERPPASERAPRAVSGVQDRADAAAAAASATPAARTGVSGEKK